MHFVNLDFMDIDIFIGFICEHPDENVILLYIKNLKLSDFWIKKYLGNIFFANYYLRKLGHII